MNAGTGLSLNGTDFSIQVPLSLSASTGSWGIISGTNSYPGSSGVYGLATGNGGAGVRGATNSTGYGV